MLRPLYTIVIVIGWVVLASSCNISRDVVQEGLFQKRKYVNKGWFIDPAARKLGSTAIVAHSVIEVEEETKDPYLEDMDLQLVSLDVSDPKIAELLIGGSNVHIVEPGITAPPITFQDRVTSEKAIRISSSAPTQDRRTSMGTIAGGSLMALSMGLVMMLPMALLFTSILALHRTIRSEANGSVFVLLALAMGMLSLGALAFI